MQLYVDAQYLSPYALSVYVALQVKGLPFDLKTVDLDAGAQHGAAYAQASLTQRVPLLADGDFQLSESSAITEYLNDTVPGPALYPIHAQARARARQVQAWLRSDLIALRVERSTNVVFQGAKKAPLSAAGEQAAAKAGDWSIADIDLAMMLQRLVQHGDAVPASLERYACAQWEHPAVQQWLALPR